jgi:hypothetical protein
MKSIVVEAGSLLCYALETLNLERVLHPCVVSLFKNREQKFEQFKDLSYETSIPKAIGAFESNTYKADGAIVVYPAEIKEQGTRVPVIILMLKDYNRNYHLTIAQHYELKDGQYIPTLYELLDFSLFLTEELRDLEHAFLAGTETYARLHKLREL